MRQALNRGSLLQGKIKLASTRGFVSSGAVAPFSRRELRPATALAFLFTNAVEEVFSEIRA